MKFTLLCFDQLGETFCIKCHDVINSSHHRGVWFPERPFEENEDGRGYIYALCMACHNEILDKNIHTPNQKWLALIEEDIQMNCAAQKYPRKKIDTSKMSGQEHADVIRSILTGRITKTKARTHK